MSKGSRDRTRNTKAYGKNHEAIFGKKPLPKGHTRVRVRGKSDAESRPFEIQRPKDQGEIMEMMRGKEEETANDTQGFQRGAMRVVWSQSRFSCRDMADSGRRQFGVCK